MTKSQQEELDLIVKEGKLSFSLERDLKSLIAEIAEDARIDGYDAGMRETWETQAP